MEIYKSINTFNFLGLKYYNAAMKQALEIVTEFVNDKKPRMIFTPTAELIVRASEDAGLRNIYNNTDLLTVDSYVVYYSARIFGKNIAEPVSAAKIMLNYLNIANSRESKIYLLGATEEVVNKTASNIKRDYPKIKIVGWHNGYFDFSNDGDVVKDIISKAPDILFVALSSPLKENFISKNLHKMNVPVSIGVGGTFDIIAGKCKLAPHWISVLCLEWFYRFIQEPRRLFKRYLVTNSKYLLLLLKELKIKKI